MVSECLGWTEAIPGIRLRSRTRLPATNDAIGGWVGDHEFLYVCQPPSSAKRACFFDPLTGGLRLGGRWRFRLKKVRYFGNAIFDTAVSPSGRQVAITSNTGLFTVNLYSGKQRTVVRNPKPYKPSPSPDLVDWK